MNFENGRRSEWRKESPAQAAKGSARTRGKTATESQKAAANERKDDLDDALSDLNIRRTGCGASSTQPTNGWKRAPEVENVLEDARKINQVLVRGKYGTQAERYSSVLRASINDLARCYNLTPLGV